MEAKIIAYVLIGIFLGPVASLAITPVFCLLRKLFFVPFIRKGLIEKAKEKGVGVVGDLLWKHTHIVHTKSGGLPPLSVMGTYTYYVNGKKYVYQHITANGIHDTLTLYYIKKPRKATVGGDLGNWESPWLKIYLIISLLVAVATVVIGMMIG